MNKYFIDYNHFTNQKPFLPYKTNLTDESISQIQSIIKIFDRKYLINIKKEMIVNLLKYNVNGNWEMRIKESEKYKKASCSLDACIVRYGETIGSKIYNEHIEKVRCKKENYTSDEWKVLCEKKKSNLGLNGYVQKYGETEGKRRWLHYTEKWKLGIKKRKASGKWKNGLTLEEYQNKWGIVEGYKRWKFRIGKHKKSLSLEGYIKKFGEEFGRNKWKNYCLSNNKTSYASFVKRYGKSEGKLRYVLMREKICKYLKNAPSYSKISQELFMFISRKIKHKEKIKYALHNGEQYFYINEDFCRGSSVDFKYENAIIEFYGNFWHANPKKYNENVLMSFPNIKKYAKDVWNYDRKKVEWLKSKGYNVLVIWEKEYVSNKRETIKKCIKFIKENYERTSS